MAARENGMEDKLRFRAAVADFFKVCIAKRIVNEESIPKSTVYQVPTEYRQSYNRPCRSDNKGLNTPDFNIGSVPTADSIHSSCKARLESSRNRAV